MKRGVVFVCWLLTAAVVPVSGAAAGSEFAEWLAGPAGFLLTDHERAAADAVPDEAAEQEFMELFWARRDPDLSTPVNEFRVAFDNRVEAADAQFAEKETRGAMTPRGRALILLGVPSRHAEMEIADYLSRLYDTPPPPVNSSDPHAQAVMKGVSFNRAKGRADLWAYSQEILPEGIQVPDGGSEVVLAFFDTLGMGVYVLQGAIRGSQEARAVLEQAPEALLLHPELNELPLPALAPGVAAATETQLRVFERESLPSLEGALLFAAQGASSGASLPLWALAVLPQDAPPAERAAGRVLTADGEALGSFQLPLSGRELAGTMVYQLAIPQPEPAAAGLELALFAGDEALLAQRLELSVEPAGQPFLSRVFAGRVVEQAADSAAGDPFVFGGYRLVPQADNRYSKSDMLNLFFLCAVPGEAAAAPSAKVRMRWYVDGSSTPSATPQSVALASAGPGVYVWGTQLPLASMAAGREYALKLKVTVDEYELERTTVVPLVISE